MINLILDLLGDLAEQSITGKNVAATIDLIETGLESYKDKKADKLDDLPNQVRDELETKENKRVQEKLGETKRHKKVYQGKSKKVNKAKNQQPMPTNDSQQPIQNNSQSMDGLDAKKLREAIILSEIVGKPVSKRRSQRSRRF